MVLPLLPITCLPIPGGGGGGCVGMAYNVSFFACFMSGDFGSCCGGVVSDVSDDCSLVDGMLCCCLSAGSGDCVSCGAALVLVRICILAAILAFLYPLFLYDIFYLCFAPPIHNREMSHPRWLSVPTCSLVHSLMIARRSLCPEKLGSNPGQGSKGINFSGWHGLDMSITVAKRR